MDIDKNQPIYMVGLDGGLRKIPTYLIDDLRLKGWRVVVNPKRTYYPEYDTTHPNYKAEKESDIDGDILELEII